VAEEEVVQHLLDLLLEEQEELEEVEQVVVLVHQVQLTLEEVEVEPQLDQEDLAVQELLL
jgi:hypothetical protein